MYFRDDSRMTAGLFMHMIKLPTTSQTHDSYTPLWYKKIIGHGYTHDLTTQFVWRIIYSKYQPILHKLFAITYNMIGINHHKTFVITKSISEKLSSDLHKQMSRYFVNGWWSDLLHHILIDVKLLCSSPREISVILVLFVLFCFCFLVHCIFIQL